MCRTFSADQKINLCFCDMIWLQYNCFSMEMRVIKIVELVSLHHFSPLFCDALWSPIKSKEMETQNDTVNSMDHKLTRKKYHQTFYFCFFCAARFAQIINHFFRIMTNGILEKQRLETHKSTLEQLKTIPFPPPLKQNQKFSPSSLELFQNKSYVL